jgi:drug/metabolite transporter (DMT)-like permease
MTTAALAHPSAAQLRATAIGATTILLWSTLATLAALSGQIPPFQLVAMSFPFAFFIGVALRRRQNGGAGPSRKLPGRVWALGIFGMFGYHSCYFLAIKNAPAVEANLINYLWPLLIVLFSAFLPGERLRWFHLAGAGLGFVGAGLLVTKGGGLAFAPQYLAGYTAAVAAALIWAIYSVGSRRFGAIPTAAVGDFCGVTAVLAGICHWLFEPTVWPTGSQWLIVLLMGLGPVGVAFFTWDIGMKHGNIKVLGALAYAAPLLSTLLLVLFGLAEPGWIIAISCLFIMGGAVLAAGEFFRFGRAI